MSKTMQDRLFRKLEKLGELVQEHNELVLELGKHVSLLKANAADGTGVSATGIAKIYELLGRLRASIDSIEKASRELLALYEQSVEH